MIMNDTEKRRQALERLTQMIRDIPVAMLTTCGPDQFLRSRPMVNVNKRFEGEIAFFSHDDDPKAQEIEANPRVNVTFAEPREDHYVSLCGKCSVKRDKKRMELLWTKECETWFPRGLEDPKLTLLVIDVDAAEYWDAHKKAMIAVSGAFQRLVGGERQGAVQHEKIDWDQ